MANTFCDKDCSESARKLGVSQVIEGFFPQTRRDKLVCLFFLVVIVAAVQQVFFALSADSADDAGLGSSDGVQNTSVVDDVIDSVQDYDLAGSVDYNGIAESARESESDGVIEVPYDDLYRDAAELSGVYGSYPEVGTDYEQRDDGSSGLVRVGYHQVSDFDDDVCEPCAQGFDEQEFVRQGNPLRSRTGNYREKRGSGNRTSESVNCANRKFAETLSSIHANCLDRSSNYSSGYYRFGVDATHLNHRAMWLGGVGVKTWSKLFVKFSTSKIGKKVAASGFAPLIGFTLALGGYSVTDAELSAIAAEERVIYGEELATLSNAAIEADLSEVAYATSSRVTFNASNGISMNASEVAQATAQDIMTAVETGELPTAANATWESGLAALMAGGLPVEWTQPFAAYGESLLDFFNLEHPDQAVSLKNFDDAPVSVQDVSSDANFSGFHSSGVFSLQYFFQGGVNLVDHPLTGWTVNGVYSDRGWSPPAYFTSGTVSSQSRGANWYSDDVGRYFYVCYSKDQDVYQLRYSVTRSDGSYTGGLICSVPSRSVNENILFLYGNWRYLGGFDGYVSPQDAVTGNYSSNLKIDNPETSSIVGRVIESVFDAGNMLLGKDAEFDSDGNLVNSGTVDLAPVLNGADAQYDSDGNIVSPGKLDTGGGSSVGDSSNAGDSSDSGFSSWRDVIDVGDVISVVPSTPGNPVPDDPVTKPYVKDPDSDQYVPPESDETVGDAVRGDGSTPPRIKTRISVGLNDLGNAVSTKFPFSVPFDIFTAVNKLQASPEAPHFTWVFALPTGNESYEVDLSDFSPVANVLRVMFNVVLTFSVIGLLSKIAQVLGLFNKEGGS